MEPNSYTAPLFHPHPKIPSPTAPLTPWTAPDLHASQQSRSAACLKSWSRFPPAPHAEGWRAGPASPEVTQSRESWHSPAGTCCPVTVTRRGRSACHGSVHRHIWHRAGGGGGQQPSRAQGSFATQAGGSIHPPSTDPEPPGALSRARRRNPQWTVLGRCFPAHHVLGAGAQALWSAQRENGPDGASTQTQPATSLALYIRTVPGPCHPPALARRALPPGARLPAR